MQEFGDIVVFIVSIEASRKYLDLSLSWRGS